jgi:hypothetical protein
MHFEVNNISTISNIGHSKQCPKNYKLDAEVMLCVSSWQNSWTFILSEKWNKVMEYRFLCIQWQSVISVLASQNEVTSSGYLGDSYVEYILKGSDDGV